MTKLSLTIKTDDVTSAIRDVDPHRQAFDFGLQMTCRNKLNGAIFKLIFSRPLKYIVHCKCYK